MQPKLSLTFCGIILFLYTQAQEPFTLEQTETYFVKNNLLLLAEQFNIDASKAAFIQARIWEHPYFSGELNALNPQNNRLIDVGNRGQKVFAIQQLIYLGGKKRKEVHLAQENIKIAELQFESLLRNLRYELRERFFELYFNLRRITSLDNQISQLDTLINAYRIQAEKGNLSMKDLVRLQTLYFDFKNQKIEIIRNNIEIQSKIRLLTGSPTDIIPTLTVDIEQAYNLIDLTALEDSTLLNIALQNRIELKIAQQDFKRSQQQVMVQKSLAIPDVILGASYDQRGGAFNNQVNFTFGIPIPLWNRNKGNIGVAKAQVSQAEAYLKYTQLLIQNELVAAKRNWIEAHNSYEQLKNTKTENFELIYNGIFNNFQKGNISLFEFTDFVESYNTSLRQFNEIIKNYILACETINYVIQTKIF